MATPQRVLDSKTRQAKRVLSALLLVAVGSFFLSQTFAAPLVSQPMIGALTTRSGSVTMAVGGEYTGFVPDMQRRILMNLVCVAATAVPFLVCLSGYALYFYPVLPSGGGGGVPVGDINGKPITLQGWLKENRAGARKLVQGLKGDAYYLLTEENGIKDFSLNATCTHLGCVVPWNVSANKFICPCHGSQYDENGKVVRGPAPLSLALAHVSIDKESDLISVAPWKETDFRTNLQPWWRTD
jgi:cytochrome b6-f complex iron-sulfur subunit